MLGNGIGKRIGDSNIFNQDHSFKRPYLASAFQIIFFFLYLRNALGMPPMPFQMPPLFITVVKNKCIFNN